MRTLGLGLVLAFLFVAAPSSADGPCHDLDPQRFVCVEFRARSVAAGDVERLVVRMRDRHLDARRSGTTVIAKMRASAAASLLRAPILECTADGGPTTIESPRAQVPVRYHRDVTSVAIVPCP